MHPKPEAKPLAPVTELTRQQRWDRVPASHSFTPVSCRTPPSPHLQATAPLELAAIPAATLGQAGRGEVHAGLHVGRTGRSARVGLHPAAWKAGRLWPAAGARSSSCFQDVLWS